MDGEGEEMLIGDCIIEAGDLVCMMPTDVDPESLISSGDLTMAQTS